MEQKQRGGKRKGAGRKKGPIPKKKISTSVPVKYLDEIKLEFNRISQEYTEKCRTEL